MVSKIILKPLTDRMIYKSDKQMFNHILITPYEKVIRILHSVGRKLQDIQELDLLKDMEYVIDKIESRSLYTFSEDFGKSDDNQDMNSMLETLNEYSENSLYRKLKKKTENITTSSNNSNAKRQITRYKTMQAKVETHSLKKVEETDESKLNNNSTTKVFGKHSSINSPEKIRVLSKILNANNPEILTKNFNIHEYYTQKTNPFSTIAKVVLKELDLDKLININNLDSFITAIKAGYQASPRYHNEMHGVDVFHSLFTYIYFGEKFEETLKFTKLITLTLLLAGLCHDVGHPGFNNNFQINTLSQYSITYNDRSVLESFHAAEATKILLDPKNNILENLDKDDFKAFRKQFVEAILATDMMFHARTNSVLRTRLASCGGDSAMLIPEDESKAYDVHQEILNFLLHTADISHNSKEFNISYEWTMRLTEEFWSQGDCEKEKGLPISFLCDRTNADIPKSQIGFIMSIIVPSFEILIDLFPSLSFLMTNIRANIDEWTIRKEEAESLSPTQQQPKRKVEFAVISQTK